MEIEKKELKCILATALALFFFFSFANSALALSIGISPSEKFIELEENQQATVYFAVSQGSKQNESITISTDADWLGIDARSFELEPGGQRYVKFTVKPLQAGNYTAKIKATASLPGVIGMRTSVTAELRLSVTPSAMASEIERKQRSDAEAAILAAQEMIKELRLVGGDTTTADIILTNAMEEFDKGYFVSAKNLADSAYAIALDRYNEKKQLRIILSPIRFALLVIGIGACEMLIYILFEMYRGRKAKPIAAKPEKSIKCPKCGSGMFKAYDGHLIARYTCPRCGYKESKEKLGFS